MEGPRQRVAGVVTESGLVGRQREREAIDRFLDRRSSAFRVLHVSGPPGIGKTTLWLAAVERARRLGWRVLMSRPTESERQLSFSGLVDLFDGLAAEAAASLPEPQRVAVDAALLRSTAERPPQPLAVSLGILGLVRAAAALGPLLVALDDVQWLDEPTSRTLEFVIRRLGDEPVAFVAAEREERPDAPLPAVIAAAAADRRIRLPVVALDVDEIGRLIEEALALDLRRPTIVRLHAMSGGNPFFALEIARAIERGQVGARDLSVPASLDELVRERIGHLPPAGRRVALYAAGLSAPTLPLVRSAVGEPEAGRGVEEAVSAGVLALDGDDVRFSHPLLRAAVYDEAAAPERRAVHRALADAVGDLEERARHLALAATDPDPSVSGALDAAAASAHARGAPAAAAELTEEAIRLTPADAIEASRRRRRAAADYHLAAGDVPRSQAILEELLEDARGRERGEILVQLGLVLMYIGGRTTAAERFREALPLVGDKSEARARAEMGLAGVSWLTSRDMDAGATHIANALRIAENLGEPTLLLEALGHSATWHFYLGRGVPREHMRRAAALDSWRSHLPAVERPDHDFAKVLGTSGEYAEARSLQDRLIDEARRAGDWNSLPWLHLASSWIEVTTGNYAAAREHVDETRKTAAQSGQAAGITYATSVETRLLGLVGDAAGCRGAADRAVAEGAALDAPHVAWEVAVSLAILDLSLGDAAPAHERLAPFVPEYSSLAEPSLWRAFGMALIEALVGIGRLDEAESVLDRTEAVARRRRRPVVLADVSAGRGFLLAARGDLEAAAMSGERAAHAFDSLGLPFERWRAMLLVGEVRRRQRRRADARLAIEAARDGFDHLGARLWAARAETSLRRSMSRRPAGDELTETERRVAELVAAGRTNREVAAALFMSVHTVEAHLTRIYRATGVQTRTELARRSVEVR